LSAVALMRDAVAMHVAVRSAMYVLDGVILPADRNVIFYRVEGTWIDRLNLTLKWAPGPAIMYSY
jgi:hypothetical protein